MPEHIYCIVRSAEDWDRATSGDPGAWSHDRDGRFPVDAAVFGARASTSVWGGQKWDVPPAVYPALAIRVLEEKPRVEVPAQPKLPRRRKDRVRREAVARSYRLPPETPEKLDFLCEAYRMPNPAQVIARLVDEAYRRDVVESGLLAVLGDDVGIIARIP